MALGFSQRFGYAVHALGYVAKKPLGELTTLPELATWMRTIWPDASETYLSNVIQRLARGGLLRSQRGVAGGYSMARPPEQITLRDVAELLEGINLNRCALSLENECPVGGKCKIETRLFHVEEAYLKSLEAINMVQLANDVGVEFPTSS